MKCTRIKKLLELNISDKIIYTGKYFLIKSNNITENSIFFNKRVINKIYFLLNSNFKHIDLVNLKFKLNIKFFNNFACLNRIYNNKGHKNSYSAIVNINFLIIKNFFLFSFFNFSIFLIFSKIKNLILENLVFSQH